jgi:hypothetical protein
MLEGRLVAGGHPPEVEREGGGKHEQDEREGGRAFALEAVDTRENRREYPLHHEETERERQQQPDANGHNASHKGHSSSPQGSRVRGDAWPLSLVGQMVA